MTNQTNQTKQETKSTEKMVKIKFTRLAWNKKIDHTEYNQQRENLLKDQKYALPSQESAIMAQLEREVYKMPIIFLPNMVYELPESEAQLYLTDGRVEFKDQKFRYHAEAHEMEHYKHVVYAATLAA